MNRFRFSAKKIDIENRLQNVYSLIPRLRDDDCVWCRQANCCDCDLFIEALATDISIYFDLLNSGADIEIYVHMPRDVSDLLHFN